MLEHQVVAVLKDKVVEQQHQVREMVAALVDLLA